MKYRVITNATVRRTYYVEDATDEKDAVNKSVFLMPDNEEEISEEVLVSNVVSAPTVDTKP